MTYDLTWTIQRVSQQTPSERHGADMMRLLIPSWERVNRYGASTAPGVRAGTSAIVPYAYGAVSVTERATRPEHPRENLSPFIDCVPFRRTINDTMNRP